MDASKSTANAHGYDDTPLRQKIILLLRGKWIILGSLFLVTGLAALYSFTAKPVYEATAMVLIDAKATQGGLPFLDLQGSATASKITNEMETLKSNSMADAVAQALLAKMFLDSARTRPIPILETSANDTELKRPATKDEVIEKLKRVIDFTPVKESDIIKITALSNDPREAALLANTYTEAYADRNLHASRVRSRTLREFLQNQLQSKRDTLDATEHTLQSYMKSSGMVNLDADTRRIVDQLAQLEASRDAIDVDISSRTKTLESYKQELAVQEPNAAKAIGESNDAYIRLLQEQLAKLEVQRDQVIAQNPSLAGESIFSQKLKEIDAEIASLKRNLQVRTQSFLKSMLPADVATSDRMNVTGFLAQLKQKIIEQQIELEGLTARREALRSVITEYEREFNQIPQKSIELAKLQRARLSSEKLYLMVEEKFNEAAITETSEFGYVDVMDRAVVPKEPVSPKILRNLLLGILLGLGFGVGIVYVRAILDDRIRTPEDLKKAGYVHLSSINRMVWDKSVQKDAKMTTEDGSKFDVHLVTHLNPLSASTESYRNLRVNVLSTLPEGRLKTIAVTSGAPGEGKTTTAANLAVSFSHAEKKVLLVDADLRRPAVHTMFGIAQQPGLMDTLLGKRPLETVIHHNLVRNLDVLCSGMMSPNPAETLGSTRMAEFITQVCRLYDVVLFDTPPVLATTDAAVLSRLKLIDGVLLVVTAGKTEKDILNRAAETLRSVGGNLLGVVLNNFDVVNAYGRYYQSYGYGYGYATSRNGKKARRKAS
jgi:capsular exopolysaccharide synthesis family protein